MERAADLESLYANRFSTSQEQRQRVWRVLTAEFFQKWVAPGDTVVDVGAGYCEFINNISAKNKYAIDLNLVSLYLKLPFAWNIFGQQFLLVARKSK